MKVVLLENVDHLGMVGDQKEVAPGYARNFLIPQKLAVKVGDSRARILLKDIAKKRIEITKDIKKIGKIAQQFEGREIKFKLKATDKGNLFGSIGPQDIAKKLKIDKKQIQFSPIRQIGKHKISVNFGHNIYANLIIVIEAQKSKTKKLAKNNKNN